MLAVLMSFFALKILLGYFLIASAAAAASCPDCGVVSARLESVGGMYARWLVQQCGVVNEVRGLRKLVTLNVVAVAAGIEHNADVVDVGRVAAGAAVGPVNAATAAVIVSVAAVAPGTVLVVAQR